MTADEPALRRLYPAEDDPGALRVELSLQGISARGVALIVTDAPPSRGAKGRCASCSPLPKPPPSRNDCSPSSMNFRE